MGTNKRLWLFFAIILAGVLWINGGAALLLWRYFSMDAKTIPAKIEWRVVRQGEEEYHLQASYQYAVRGKQYEGSDITKDSFRNPYAGTSAQKEMQKQKVFVWYNTNNPSQSAIEHVFPLKETIYSAIMWSILIYFACLLYYVGREPQT